MKKIILSIAILSMFGCTASLYKDEASLNNLINESPILESQAISGTKNPAGSIVFYYKSWHLLSVPDNLDNWKYHYKVGESSSPNFKFRKITSFTHYSKNIDDENVKKILQITASKIGGSAIVNFYREPVIDGRMIPAKIIAYKYKGDVVVKL